MAVPRKAITKKLGELLVEHGFLQEKQLEEGLVLQKEKGGLLGKILVELGHVTEDQVVQVVTMQYGFPYLPLKSYLIDPKVIELVPTQVARQYSLIPLDRIEDTLTVAMADPMNTHAIEDLELLSGCSIQVFVSTLSDVAEAIQKYYGSSNA